MFKFIRWINHGRINVNTRLLKHYSGLLVSDKDKCFDKCYLDNECNAASFILDEANYCYFYSFYAELNQNEQDFSGWISFIKKDGKEKLHMNKRFINQKYFYFLSKSRRECFDKCDSKKECFGASIYSKPKNCFFYKQDFIETKKNNWISYIKNF
jgi:hypothetical protein